MEVKSKIFIRAPPKPYVKFGWDGESFVRSMNFVKEIS